MDGSGFADYSDAHNPKYGHVTVPLRKATAESLKDYGHIVNNFEKEEVWITTWPLNGWRKMCPGTGNCGGIVSDKFIYKWEGEYLKANNKAVHHGNYTTGRLPKGASLRDRTHVLVREANYHPDGGQVFYPVKSQPFVALLALPGDDVKPKDFVAFYFDGSFGMQIKADIWHQPMYPVTDEAEFDGKQGAVHGCVTVDTVDEFGQYLLVPLKSDFMEN